MSTLLGGLLFCLSSSMCACPVAMVQSVDTLASSVCSKSSTDKQDDIIKVNKLS